MTRKPTVAIIGAGITGLQLARRLSVAAEVKVFEKSRGIGGRMSTRRAGAYQFDHGAQYFTAQGQAFQKMLEPYVDAGVVAQWNPRLTALGADAQQVEWKAPRYVAVPSMNALCKTMAEGVEVIRQTRIEAIAKAPHGGWTLTGDAGEACGSFDWVLCTAPAEQTARLMPACFGEAAVLHRARMLGCYSVMLGGADLSALAWDAATVSGSPLAWIAANHSKPGRPDVASLLAQSSNTWAEDNLEENPDIVQASLLAALKSVTGVDIDTAEYVSLHKWRFAKVKTPADRPYLLDAKQRLGAAGDWCGAGRVEAGFESGDALSSRLLEDI